MNEESRIQRLQELAEKYFPLHIEMQKQWIEKTRFLEDTGRHARFTGGFKIGGTDANDTK